MAHLIAFEAKLCITVERVVCVLATEDAVWAAPLIRALFCHVAKLLAVSTFDRWIVFSVVARHLVLQSREHVIFRQQCVAIVLSSCLLYSLMSTDLTVRCRNVLPLSVLYLPAKVHVALYSTTWNDQVWIALSVDRRDVVVVILSLPCRLSRLHLSCCDHSVCTCLPLDNVLRCL